MTEGAEVGAPVRRKSWWRRLLWPLLVALVLGFLELLSRQFIARPNRILRSSADPEMVYENASGTWLGHAKADVWRAPVYMVLDLINTGAEGHKGPAPAGYTIYKMDDEGCRVPSEGPVSPTADIILLGSSQAFGLFVPEEDTVRAMLEKSLQARGFPGVHVANCGVIGHHFLPTLRTGETRRKTKKPRLIVTLVRPWHMREQFDYTEVLTPNNEAMKWITNQSSFARALFYWKNRGADQFNKPYVSVPVLDAKLDHYAKEMSEDGVRSIYFLLDDGSAECTVFDDLKASLERHGLAAERLITPNDSRDYFIDKERHWNAKGAARTTADILDSVVRELQATRAATPAAP